MSKEKQIEEMAWDLCDIPKHPSIKSCEQCGNKRCLAMYYAERAYNADYRKQSEGEWLINRSSVEAEFKCSECRYSYIDADSYAKVEYNYCPNCGAHMRKEDEGK